MKSFRFVLQLVTSVALFAAAPTSAVAFTDDALCSAGQTLVTGTAGADRLRGTRGEDCLIAGDGDDRVAGGGGDDRIAGGSGNDVIEPGPGRDTVNAGAGDDIIVIRSLCEIEPGERLSGGPGRDTVRSPVGLEELRALGGKVRSIEVVEIAVSLNGGACIDGPEDVVCSCCTDPGADPAAGCTSCLPGHFLRQYEQGAGDFEGATLPAAQCVAITSCAELDCGAHGTCIDGESGGACLCEPGYAGRSCDACAPLWEEITPGTCVLGEACARERCGGHGLCVLEGEAIRCRCDDGWDLGTNCGGDPVVLGGPRNVQAGAGPQSYSVVLANGAHCTTDFVWSLGRGSGMLTPDAATSTRAVYTPPTNTPASVDHVEIKATCANDASVQARVDGTVAANPASLNRGRPITGVCDPKVAAAFDDAVPAYMADNNIVGGTLAVTCQEDVVCLRGRGYREFGFSFGGPLSVPTLDIELMQPCTPLRVASVAKPFTRAVLRGNLFGSSIPAALGGGTLGESTPLLPLIADSIGLGPNGEVPMQIPLGFYGVGHLAVTPGTGVTCNAGDGLVHPSWNLMTLGQVLDHRAGFQPNQTYAFGPGFGGCRGVAGEICGQLGGPSDPTIGAITRMNNDLGIGAYGEPTTTDAVRWLAGVCPFDTPVANRFRYSNAGFTVLGEVIENLTGQSYEDHLVGILEADGIVDLDAPGRPVVYLAQSKGGGPRTWSLPSYMPESNYFSPRSDGTDVAAPVVDADTNQWTFPNVVPAMTWELETAEPPIDTNVNGIGCLVRDDVTDADSSTGFGLDVLEVEPCVLPPGIRVSLLFNTDLIAAGSADFVRGRHDAALMGHLVRGAAAKVGQPATEWDAVVPMDESELGIDCETKCPAESPCVPVTCGDGALDPAEMCDDGNNVSNDGCQADCKLPPPPASEPGGYAACAGEDPGTCLGGPCAAREMQFVTDSDRLDWFSDVHPDGYGCVGGRCWEDLPPN